MNHDNRIEILHVLYACFFINIKKKILLFNKSIKANSNKVKYYKNE